MQHTPDSPFAKRNLQKKCECSRNGFGERMNDCPVHSTTKSTAPLKPHDYSPLKSNDYSPLHSPTQPDTENKKCNCDYIRSKHGEWKWSCDIHGYQEHSTVKPENVSKTCITDNKLDTESWEEEFDKRYQISETSWSFDTVNEIWESDVKEIKSFIHQVSEKGYQKGLKETCIEIDKSNMEWLKGGDPKSTDFLKKLIEEGRQSTLREIEAWAYNNGITDKKSFTALIKFLKKKLQ